MQRTGGSSTSRCLVHATAGLKRPTCRYSARLLCNPCHLNFDEALVGKEKKCLKPGDSFKDCPACPEMVVTPAGTVATTSVEG